MTDQLKDLPAEQPLGQLEEVAHFHGPMPTGVTVSHEGRIFVNFPKWGDDVEYTVAEVVDGQTVAYPNQEINRTDPNNLGGTLVSVQSVVVDPANRLWILDTGSPLFQPTEYGGPKLVCVDLATDTVVKTILFAQDVALPTSYLNDVRFDLRRGNEGVAYLTDSSDQGPNGIVVTDLATRRKLAATARPPLDESGRVVRFRAGSRGAAPAATFPGRLGRVGDSDGLRWYRHQQRR
jgi:sugar lactone lactonase YvrE